MLTGGIVPINVARVRSLSVLTSKTSTVHGTSIIVYDRSLFSHAVYVRHALCGGGARPSALDGLPYSMLLTAHLNRDSELPHFGLAFTGASHFTEH